MLKKIAAVDLKRQFPYPSKGIERELFLTLGQVFKEKIKEKIGNGIYGILTDRVTDISLTQQLVTFIQYYDSQSCTTTTSFLAISNTLKGNNSADAPQIKKILEQLQSVGLEVQTMRSFVSHGESVMTGARNGVANLPKDENPLILSFHCLTTNLLLLALPLQIPLTTLPTVNYSWTSCGSYSTILQSTLPRILKCKRAQRILH